MYEVRHRDLHFFPRAEVERRLQLIRNKTLGEIDKAHVFERMAGRRKVTGIAGSVIEQSVFGYPPDSRQEPDLLVDMVPTELKTTGLRRAKRGKGLEAKEPMSITAVSLDTITRERFEYSHFWRKLEHLLIVYYLYDAVGTVPAGDYARFPIKGYQFHEFDARERSILKNDWETVRAFIVDIQERNATDEARKREYPLLSSALRSQLMFIDTAPKYPHPPRFRLKRGTVTAMARKVFGYEMEQLPETYESFTSLDHVVHQRSARFVGLSLREIFGRLNRPVPRGAKNIASVMLSRLLGGRGTFDQTDLSLRAEIETKSCVLTSKGLRTEDMKMFTINFAELTMPDVRFEDSQFFDYFNRTFYIAVLEEPNHAASLADNVFCGFKRLVFSEEFIRKEVYRTWSVCRSLIIEGRLKNIPALDRRTGEPIINKTGVARVAPNFPKSSDSIVFVRGTSSNSTKKPEVVNGISMYRQQVWIKGKYAALLLSELPWV